MNKTQIAFIKNHNAKIAKEEKRIYSKAFLKWKESLK